VAGTVYDVCCGSSVDVFLCTEVGLVCAVLPLCWFNEAGSLLNFEGKPSLSR
jgi:hypothetical protein